MFRALTCLDEMKLAAARASALASRAAATAAGLRYAELDADALVAQLDALEGDVDAGLARMMRVAREAREAGMEDVGVTAYRNAAALAMRLMDYRTAEAALAEGLRYADAVEQSHCRHVMRATAAMLAWADGRWDEAVSGGRQELADRGCRRGLLGSLDAIGYVAVGRGMTDTAREALNRSLVAGRASGELERTFPALWGLAEAAIVAGEPAAAADRCGEAIDLAAERGERALFVPFVVTGVRAWLALNRPDEAERWAMRAIEHLAGWEEVARPAVDHATGLLRMANGSLSAARDALEAAERAWAERGRAWEHAWARLDLAQCLMRTNQYGAAASLLAAVRAWAEEVDSPPLLARADELARVGRGRGLLAEPWRPLTVREFEVARLIADGMTNGEIAGELTIAPKTASAHVEHILAKLGVTRRAEIAAWTATIVTTGTAGAAGREARAATRVR
jgi:DNA-binding CsgD family transcriptional regulator